LGKGTSPFVHGELELAAASGIAQKNLARARQRHLREGEDWDLAGLQVAYSKNGLARVLEKVTGKPVEQGAIAGVPLLELEEKTRLTPANGDDQVMAKVARLYQNPHLLQIALPDGQLTNVRVKFSKNFRRGMEIPIVRTEQGYELARRLPRFPGRW
jgi:hypothetical protein